MHSNTSRKLDSAAIRPIIAPVKSTFRRLPENSRIAPFNPATCLPGFVWRRANSTDAVCVTSATAADVQQQNHLGPSRSNGLICVPGFVWRQANSADHVCVTPAEQQQASFDNLLAPSRRAIP
jgi:hypothetical protein